MTLIQANPTFVESLRNSLASLLHSDPKVFLMGEDIEDPYGGAFKVTHGLSTSFPGRVLNTPISEAAIAGIASGAALRGMKPVVEIMFGDFLGLCFDQIWNHMTKFRAMYGSEIKIPVVIRTPVGAGRGYGPTHSQTPEAFFFGMPGLSILAPCPVHSPGEILSAALESGNPSLFLEPKLSYGKELWGNSGTSGRLRWDIHGSTTEFPTARVFNFAELDDPDVFIFSYGCSFWSIMEAMESLANDEIKVMASFPSLLSPLPHHLFPESSRRKVGVVTVEENSSGFNWGSEIICSIQERRLYPEIICERICLPSVPIPASRRLENEILPNGNRITTSVLNIAERVM